MEDSERLAVLDELIAPLRVCDHQILRDKAAINRAYPDFTGGVIANFIERLVEYLNHTKDEVFLYYCQSCKKKFHRWSEAKACPKCGSNKIRRRNGLG